MFDEATIEHFHSGCAVIVGTVSADNVPRAGRGWGLTVLTLDPPKIRVLLDADDGGTIANLEATGAIAVTTADVATLHSLQLKGRSTGIEVPADHDLAKATQYREDFFTDIVETDHLARATLDAWAATRFVACTIEVHDCFTQTPGPSAGSPLDAPS